MRRQGIVTTLSAVILGLGLGATAHAQLAKAQCR
jgi:hypothetical protein